MELLRDSVPMVILAVSAVVLYERAVSSRTPPGFPRLAMLLPVGAFFAAVPFAFSSAILRLITAHFMCLAMFKVVLLAKGHDWLHPGLPVHQFLFVAALPVEIDGHPDDPHAIAAAAAAGGGLVPSLVSGTLVKVTVVAAILHVCHCRLLDGLHVYARYAVYSVLIWFFLELVSACVVTAGGAVVLKVKPHFDRPYLSTSVQDFWGRRWNLVVSAVLRRSVYDPLRRRVRKEAAIMATFLVSGLMHEALALYVTPLPPTGELAAFFLLQGACRVAEERCARRWAPPLPPLVRRLFVYAFLICTTFWLIFPPIGREGREEMLLEELEVLAAFFTGII
ncbi:hypothetical protein ACP4OV_028547 [Aristida adscensionis]